MANPLRGEGAIEVDGTRFLLKLDINALCVAEKISGMRTAELMVDIDAGSLTSTRAVFYASLLNHQPSMTLEQSGDIMTEGGVKKVVDALVDIIAAAFPKVEAGTPKNP